MCWRRLSARAFPCTIYLSVTSSAWSRSVECTRCGESVTGCDPLTAPPWKVTLSANHDYIKCHSLSLSLLLSVLFFISCPRSKLLYITVAFFRVTPKFLALVFLSFPILQCVEIDNDNEQFICLTFLRTILFTST